MRKYIQRMRAIRDINKLINELESHESEWKHTSLAARNRLLLKKWKEQIKVYGILCSLLKGELTSKTFKVLIDRASKVLIEVF